MDKTKDKIAIISTSLGKGGAERFACQLSFMLHDLGYEIHHIIVNDIVDYDFKGYLYDLEAHCKNDFSIIKKIKKGILLNHYLKDKKIDIVIDNRSRNVLLRELMTKWIYRHSRVFYMVHSYHLENYFPENSFLSRKIYQDAEQLICVSRAIESKIKEKYHLKNTITIYNSIEPVGIEKAVANKLPEKYILFFGRLEENVKNFTLMLGAFAESKIYEKGYQLIIMGSGSDLNFIQNRIQKLNLQNHVKIIPFQSHPFEYVKNAKFTILTSHYEGFPMSIIESLAMGTPVIAVDCNSGPAEIIINETNGLLVDNYNLKELAIAINRFADDNHLYDICKNNASKSVEHLSAVHISKQWQQILSQK